MNFYHSIHRHYCGIDPHARSLCVCITDQQGEVVVVSQGNQSPTGAFLALLDPFSRLDFGK